MPPGTSAAFGCVCDTWPMIHFQFILCMQACTVCYRCVLRYGLQILVIIRAAVFTSFFFLCFTHKCADKNPNQSKQRDAVQCNAMESFSVRSFIHFVNTMRMFKSETISCTRNTNCIYYLEKAHGYVWFRLCTLYAMFHAMFHASFSLCLTLSKSVESLYSPIKIHAVQTVYRIRTRFQLFTDA